MSKLDICDVTYGGIKSRKVGQSFTSLPLISKATRHSFVIYNCKKFDKLVPRWTRNLKFDFRFLLLKFGRRPQCKLSPANGDSSRDLNLEPARFVKRLKKSVEVEKKFQSKLNCLSLVFRASSRFVAASINISISSI